MKIDHIAIATRGLAEATAVWKSVFGIEAESTEEVAEQGVRVAMLPVGDAHIELLEPLTSESPISKFLEKRGPGLHHVAVRVNDISAVLDQLKAKGTRLIDEAPRQGARGCLVAFIHPSATNGVLLELVQHQ